MASIYQLEPEKLFTVPSDDQVTECKLCYEIAQPKDGIDLGPLFQYGKIVKENLNHSNPGEDNTEMEIYCAHYFCLLFASALSQRGEDDSIGMKGFLTEDILKEWRRAARLKCFRCNKKYATVGCAAKKCRKSFHLPCALRDNALPQFCLEFRLYCGEHRIKQSIYSIEDSCDVGERECGICSETLTKFPEDTIEEEIKNIWTPCCSKWFHRECIQKFAETSGYFFKCPLCNNKEIFEMEMQSFGIYVPEQDAAWETQDNGTLYDDLLERHNRCDADECKCPEGREADEDYTIWEIILCWCCGAQGIHVQCGDLPLSKDMVKWKCNFCLETIRKMPKRIVHKFKPITNSRSRKPSLKQGRLSFRDQLDNITIKVGSSETENPVGGDNKVEFRFDDKGISAKIDLCPKYDVPLPVKLSNIPWIETNPRLEKLKQEARKSRPIVRLKKMDLDDIQYSVFTIWRPRNPKSNSKTINGDNIELQNVCDIETIFTPKKKLANCQLTVKPRSPSLPKSISSKLAISPRSQSLPSKLKDEKLSKLDETKSSRVTVPKAKLSYDMKCTPKKVKFLGEFKRTERLTRLKPIRHIIERADSAKSERSELTHISDKIMPSKKFNNISKVNFSNCNDALPEQNLVSPSKILCEKRKNIVHSPHQSKKKMKLQDNLKIVSQSEHEIEVNRRNISELQNECLMINNDFGKPPVFRYRNRFHDEDTKENTEHIITGNKIIKERNNLKDLVKSQKSILQYFSTQQNT